ncbi:MAG: hypothetical protein WAX89_06120 [Alphaproteobacteria bacterium]
MITILYTLGLAVAEAESRLKPEKLSSAGEHLILSGGSPCRFELEDVTHFLRSAEYEAFKAVYEAQGIKVLLHIMYSGSASEVSVLAGRPYQPRNCTLIVTLNRMAAKAVAA